MVAQNISTRPDPDQIRGCQSESKHWDDPGSQPWPRLGRNEARRCTPDTQHTVVFAIALLAWFYGKAMSSYCTTNTMTGTDSATPLRRARHDRVLPALLHSRQADRGDRY